MFSFFKKNNEQFNSDDKKVTFEIELTAAVLAYEIARIDGEVSDEELSVLMEEIKSISKKANKDEKEILKIIKIYSSDSTSFYEFIEDINDAPVDKPLIFSAHGVAKNILDTAKQMNKYVVDATCPLVTKVHVQAIKFYNLDYKIILIGHKNHPEVEGTLGQLPAGGIVLIENLDDIQNLKFENEDKLAYVTQTTLSVDDTKEIIDALKKKFPHIKSSPKEDICYATTNRQNAIKDYAHECDSFIVVGSKNSSNSNRLVEVCLLYTSDAADD